jgi:hypothetical protein
MRCLIHALINFYALVNLIIYLRALADLRAGKFTRWFLYTMVPLRAGSFARNSNFYALLVHLCADPYLRAGLFTFCFNFLRADSYTRCWSTHALINLHTGLFTCCSIVTGTFPFTR